MTCLEVRRWLDLSCPSTIRTAQKRRHYKSVDLSSERQVRALKTTPPIHQRNLPNPKVAAANNHATWLPTYLRSYLCRDCHRCPHTSRLPNCSRTMHTRTRE